jgi:hypothetical protein
MKQENKDTFIDTKIAMKTGINQVLIRMYEKIWTLGLNTISISIDFFALIEMLSFFHSRQDSQQIRKNSQQKAEKLLTR